MMAKSRNQAVAAAFGMLLAGFAGADNGSSFAPENGTIGYVMTDLFWAVYQTPDGQEECPKGYNDGPREQFAVLFPNHEQMTVVETQLKQEIET